MLEAVNQTRPLEGMSNRNSSPGGDERSPSPGQEDRKCSTSAENEGATVQGRARDGEGNEGSSARSTCSAATQKDSDDCRDEDQDRSPEWSGERDSSTFFEDGASGSDLRPSEIPPCFWGHAAFS